MPSKNDNLKIVGNGAAERARRAAVENKKRKKSALDEIAEAQRVALGIGKEKVK